MGHMLDDRRESPDTSDARVSRGSKWRESINTTAQHTHTKKGQKRNSSHPPANGCSDMPRSEMTWFHAFSDIPGGLRPLNP